MSDHQPSTSAVTESPDKPVTPLRCLIGGAVALAIAVLLYQLTQSIAISFAAKPIHTDNLTVQRLSSAIRTLVVGMSAMGTGIFGLAAFGLLGLSIQLVIQRLKGMASPPANP